MSQPNAPRASTQIRNPLVGVQMDDLAAVYMRKLEARLLLLTVHNIRLRARLELATGEAWDAENIADLSGDALHEEIIQSMMRGLGLDYQDAARLVRENFDTANPAVEKIGPSAE